MNEIQEIHEIHAAFEFDILNALAANAADARVEQLRPAGVNPDEFNRAVAEYRLTYPQNNFITERQIIDICTKHGLFAGSLLAFSGTIPVRNRSQMMNFKLSDRHRVIRVNDMPQRIVADARNSQRMNTMIVTPPSYSTAPAYFEFSSGFIPADMDNPFRVIPVGEHFVLLRIGETPEYKIFYETIIHGSPWLVEFGVGSLEYGSVVYSWQQAFDRFDFRPGVGQTTVTKSRANVSLRLTLDQIQRANVLDLSVNVSPIVVAPRSMFTRFGDAVEVSGHRIKFRASETLNNASFRWVDDPIVLQPVPFGYLVVTKWGAESRIPEIQSPVEN